MLPIPPSRLGVCVSFLLPVHPSQSLPPCCPLHTLASSLCLGPSDVAEREQCDVLSLPAHRHQNLATQQKDTLTCWEKEAHTSPAAPEHPSAEPVAWVCQHGCPMMQLGECHQPWNSGKRGHHDGLGVTMMGWGLPGWYEGYCDELEATMMGWGLP